jgi:hypothetical protein
MAWKTNDLIPLDKETQVAVGDAVAKFAGLDPEKPGEQGEKCGYVQKDKLANAKGRVGTCCGTKGNVFSEAMIELFNQAEHIVMCWFQEGTKRSEVAAMAVKGFTFAQADEMSRLAKEAGCSLRPDVANINGESWVLFESE